MAMRVSEVNKLLNEKGLTLPELIITLSLLSLVILVAVTIMFMGASSHQAAEVSSILNGELRAEANYITEQIRNASEIEILEEEEFSKEDAVSGYNYIYLKNGKVEKITSGAEGGYIPRNNLVNITNLKFELDEDSNEYLFEFSVEGEVSRGNQEGKDSISSYVIAEYLTGYDVSSRKEGNILKYKPRSWNN